MGTNVPVVQKAWCVLVCDSLTESVCGRSENKDHAMAVSAWTFFGSMPLHKCVCINFKRKPLWQM